MKPLPDAIAEIFGQKECTQEQWNKILPSLYWIRNMDEKVWENLVETYQQK